MSEIEKSCKQPWFNYSTDKEDFHRRVENFRQETQAMLQMPRQLEISVTNIRNKNIETALCTLLKHFLTASKSTSASNVNQTPRLSTKTVDSHLLKTHSASNVFTRTINVDNRHSLDNSYQVQYNKNTSSDFGGSLCDANRNESVNTQNGRLVRRGSSVENVNSSSMDLNANGAMKKVKYENEVNLRLKNFRRS